MTCLFSAVQLDKNTLNLENIVTSIDVKNVEKS